MQPVPWTHQDQWLSLGAGWARGGPKVAGTLNAAQALLALSTSPESPAWPVFDFFALLYKGQSNSSLGAV